MTDLSTFTDWSYSHGLLFADVLVGRIVADEKLTTIRPVTAATSRLSALGRHMLVPGRYLAPDRDLWRECKPAEAPGVLHLPHGEIAFSRVQAGDTIWVREAWRPRTLDGDTYRSGTPVAVTYRAEEGRPQHVYDVARVDPLWRWPLAASRPSAGWCSPLIMPEWAARLRRTVVDVRLARLLDVDEEAARLDGFEDRASFQQLWNAAYAGKGLGTEENPWVWVYRWEKAEGRAS